jgi:hypothetical protein
LATRLGIPLLVGTLQPQAHEPGFFLEIERLSGEPPETMTQSVASALERAILRSREQWLWMARPSSEGGPD